jgi:hypothetical protein
MTKAQTEEIVRQQAVFASIKLDSLAEHIEKYESAELGNLLVALQWHSRRFKSGEFDHLIRARFARQLS